MLYYNSQRDHSRRYERSERSERLEQRHGGYNSNYGRNTQDGGGPTGHQNRNYRNHHDYLARLKPNQYSSYASSSYRSRQNVYLQHNQNYDLTQQSQSGQSGQLGPLGPLGGQQHQQFQMWMGDLDPYWTEESIKTMWSTLVSAPIFVKIVRDRVNPLKPQFAFVGFDSQELLDLAVKRNGQPVPQSLRRFKLNYTKSGGRGSSYAQSQFQSQSQSQSQSQFQSQFQSQSQSQYNVGLRFGSGGKGKGGVVGTHNGAAATSAAFGSGIGNNGSYSNSYNNSIGGEFTMFVGDLSPEVSESALFAKFNLKYPNQIRSARVIMDPLTKKSRGFGFVKFNGPDTLNKALKEMQGLMLGSKAIRVGIAAGSETALQSAPSETRNELYRIQLPQPQPTANYNSDENNTTLTLTNLQSLITEKELEQHFAAFGDIVYCKITTDGQTGHVKFLLRSSANSALMYMNGLQINGLRPVIGWGATMRILNEDTNFWPSNSGRYEASDPVPSLYIPNRFKKRKFDNFDETAVKALQLELDESEIHQTNQIDSIYLEDKIARAAILES